MKWYFKTSVLVIAFLCVGPFALPLLWFNSRFSLTKKIIISLIVLIASYYLTILSVNALKSVHDYYQQLLKELKL